MIQTIFRDSSVSIVTVLRAGRSGDRVPVVSRFFAPVQTSPGAHPASYTIGTWSFLGVKRPGRGVDQPPPSSAEVEGRVELYICSPSRRLWPVLRRSLQYAYTTHCWGRFEMPYFGTANQSAAQTTATTASIKRHYRPNILYFSRAIYNDVTKMNELNVSAL